MECCVVTSIVALSYFTDNIVVWCDVCVNSSLCCKQYLTEPGWAFQLVPDPNYFTLCFFSCRLDLLITSYVLVFSILIYVQGVLAFLPSLKLCDLFLPPSPIYPRMCNSPTRVKLLIDVLVSFCSTLYSFSTLLTTGQHCFPLEDSHNFTWN